jgi:catechol 2,3-dioxygenase-like lactoylglutathione lyase family enzyme
VRLDLDHLAVRTSDPEQLRDFYIRVLGAATVELDRGRIGLRLGNVQLHVHGPKSTPEPLPAKMPPPGSFDACFVWPGSADAALDHLRAHGLEPETAPVPRRGAAGNGTSVYFRDPDGNLLELITYA